MNLPPPPSVPLLKSPTMNRAPTNFPAPQLSQQQIEERLSKTREVFAKIGQIKTLPPQLTQSASYFFLPTNSSFMNEAIVVLPRIENDGRFELPPVPGLPEIKPSPLPK